MNSPTIDGVSREFVRVPRIPTDEMRDAGNWHVCDRSVLFQAWEAMIAAALLDADHIVDSGKMVEPVAYANPKAFENFGSLAHLGGLYAHEWMFAGPAPELVPLYREAPELAALQSTIAQLQARVSELESGMGEIVGFRYRANGDWELMEESPFADGRAHYRLGGEELQPVYAAPPAVVAVVLPERKDPTQQWHIVGGVAQAEGWNACLVATAALNGERG